MMTTTLAIAFAEVAKLPPDDQEAFATWILAELESERRWAHLFTANPALLTTLADEALEEYRRGKTQPLDPESW